MIRQTLVAAATAAILCGAAGARPPAFEPSPGRDLGPDRLAEALAAVGLERGDLGIQPRGYWSRFPRIDRIPHILPFLPDLLADPLETYGFARVMAGAVAEHLAPEYRAARDDAMYKVVHFLGVEKRVVGPRGYDYAADFAVFADPRAPGAGDLDPALAVLRQLHEAAGAAFDEGAAQDRLRALPAPLHPPLADLLRGLGQSLRWHGIALAGVDHADRDAVLARRPLHDKDWAPQVDRVARDLDEVSLYHAAQLAVLAVERARRGLAAAADSLPPGVLAFAPVVLSTPGGRVVVAGTGADTHGSCLDCLALVDLGGDDRYEGAVGAASSAGQPLSVAIDLAGNDAYLSPPDGAPTQGAGILGVGILLDGAGDDRYEAGDIAQGVGFFGLGLAWDDGGDDRRRMHFSGQGAGYFGVGLLVDGGGRDEYDLWADGQGFGGVGGGVGVLADRDGDDRYRAEPDAHITRRGSQHTHDRVTSSNAQGAASGRRGDISDGHAWAGGLGALIDLAGDDAYEAGNWAIGSGYWFGAGILYDGGGADRYRAVYYALASGAHFCLGAVFDDGDGDDEYRLWDPPIADDLVPAGRGMNATGGAGLAFAWDFCVSLLVDKGGADRYSGRIISGGLAMIRSTAILADLGSGADDYLFPAGDGAGKASSGYIGVPDDALPSFTVEYSPASNYGANVALFLDAGGADRYRTWATDGDHPVSPLWRDSAAWQQPAPGDSTYGNASFGVGLDVEGGTVPEFHRFERQERRY